jgi:large subunit ribosomal protein L23
MNAAQPSVAGHSAEQHREERLLRVLLGPIVSEKSTMLADKVGQIAFHVVPDATRDEVKAAVELLFKVEVNAVNMLNIKGRAKRFGRFHGRRDDVRKAYVRLAPGQEIDFTEVK